MSKEEDILFVETDRIPGEANPWGQVFTDSSTYLAAL